MSRVPQNIQTVCPQFSVETEESSQESEVPVEFGYPHSIKPAAEIFCLLLLR